MKDGFFKSAKSTKSLFKEYLNIFEKCFRLISSEENVLLLPFFDDFNHQNTQKLWPIFVVPALYLTRD